MTTVQEDRDFIKNVIAPMIPDGVLGDAIDWMKSNLHPEDVFSEEQLSDWAREKGFIF